MKNEPAFPAPNFSASTTHEGMTLRDFFAAQALIGWRDSSINSIQEHAEDAYRLADAMLKEREAA